MDKILTVRAMCLPTKETGMQKDKRSHGVILTCKQISLSAQRIRVLHEASDLLGRTRSDGISYS
jgi:hypothetical protein